MHRPRLHAHPEALAGRVRGSLSRRAVAAAVAIVLLYAISVLTPNGQLLSDLVLTGRPTDDPDRVAAAKDVLHLVSVASLAVAGLLIAAVALLRGRPWLAVAMLVAIVGANVTTQVLKRLVLERPALGPDLGVGTINSFPSGHTTVAAVLALTLLLVAPTRLRLPVALAGAVFLVLIGTSTLVAGWHRAEDVAGGGAVALLWAAGAGAVVARLRGVEPVAARTARNHQVAGWLLLGLALLGLLLGGVSWIVAFTDPWAALDILDDGTPSATRLFAGAFTVAAATALLTVATAWRAIRGGQLEQRRAAVEVVEAVSPEPARSRPRPWRG